MNYLGNPDIFEEIDGRETAPLTGNIIGAIDVHRALGLGLNQPMKLVVYLSVLSVGSVVVLIVEV